MALRRVRVPFETEPKNRAFQQSLSARRAQEDATPDRGRQVLGALRIDTTLPGGPTTIRVPTFLARQMKGWQVTTQSAPGTFSETARDARTVTIEWTPAAGATIVNFGLRVW